MNNFLTNMPSVVRNLLIINVLMFVVTFIFGQLHIDLNRILGLYYFDSPNFKPFQIITYLFMHGGIFHILFNMYAVWMFGSILEKVWGHKKFLTFFLITGLGAAAIHMGVQAFEVYQLTGSITIDVGNTGFTQYEADKLGLIYYVPTIGASGAVFGLLLANGMLFPNNVIMLMLPPIPLKMKYFVLIYGGIELWMGISNTGDNIAHFAHLGGMLFGFILIKYWQKKGDSFY